MEDIWSALAASYVVVDLGTEYILCGIEMGLVMPIVTSSVFLLEFYHPFDFSKFLFPNLIDWKFQLPPGINGNILIWWIKNM